MSWTPERLDKLRTLYAEGLSASQIAGQLGGVTRNAVIGKFYRMGLPRRGRPRPQSPTRIRRGMGSGTGTNSGGGIGVNIARGVGKAFAWRAPSKPLPKEPPKAPGNKPVTLLRRHSHQCCWPTGGGFGPTTKMCGARKDEIDEVAPYCAWHTKIATGHSAPAWTPERRANFYRAMGIGAAMTQ